MNRNFLVISGIPFKKATLFFYEILFMAAILAIDYLFFYNLFKIYF